MQSGVAVELAERLFAEVPFDQAGQEGAPPGVQQPHAADMRGVVPRLDELRQRALDQQVPAAVQLGVGGFQRLHQWRRQHHIAEAQRRVECFAEGADVNHRRVGFQPLQRRDRLAGKAEFAVVVVLDDPTAGVARQRQQPLAARQAHHQAERILVRRGNEDQPRRVGRLLRRHQPGFVHRQRADVQRIDAQDIADPPIARFFDPGVIPRIAQHARHQIDRLMDALGDQDLFRRAAYRARHP